jgi:hypothetical protein
MRVQNFNRLATEYARLLNYGVANKDLLENFIWQDGCCDVDKRTWFQRLTRDEEPAVVLSRRQKLV